MYITVAADKGGVGKTTAAVHLAAYLQKLGPTLLIDGDITNRSASDWAENGGHVLPFEIVNVAEGTYKARNFEHVVIDTAAQPDKDELEQLASGCDLLVITTVPAGLETRALKRTLNILQVLAADKYRVLLTKVPPRPETDGPDLRAALVRQGIPVFAASIPRLKCFDKAAGEGVLVHAVKDRRAARAWAAYEALGKGDHESCLSPIDLPV